MAIPYFALGRSNLGAVAAGRAAGAEAVGAGETDGAVAAGAGETCAVGAAATAGLMASCAGATGLGAVFSGNAGVVCSSDIKIFVESLAFHANAFVIKYRARNFLFKLFCVDMRAQFSENAIHDSRHGNQGRRRGHLEKGGVFMEVSLTYRRSAQK